MLSHDDECIVAQCTPKGTGALALLRISGRSVRNLISKISFLASKKQISEVPSHTIHYGSFNDSSGKSIDHVMFIVMDGPRTFTGQDVIEITCHNNPFIIEAIIKQIIQQGARHAQEGEFTRRAFQAGKIDLTQAEAIHELIGAQTQQALKASLAQIDGSLTNWIKTVEHDLLQAIAWCEASFEFLDEEVEFKSRIEQRLDSLLSTITSLQHMFNSQQQIRQGMRIALIGSVNTGKSSLFNALLDQKRAIVSNIPGTTRDSVEAGIVVEGNYWTLVDTAGLRTTDDLIEQEGIKRSHEEAQKADIVLLVVDGSRSLSSEELAVYQTLHAVYSTKTILICTKSDQPEAQNNSLIDMCDLQVSSIANLGIEKLKDAILQKIGDLVADLDSPFLVNARQNRLLISLENKLFHIRSHMLIKPQYELISYHLQDALSSLSELTGRTISEAALDKIFKEFCVGK